MLNGQQFQFPSNGKVFPNDKISVEFTSPNRFNSLQTGRSFRTIGLSVIPIHNLMGFNSLQTGWSFRTQHANATNMTLIECVSIPFKREGLSEQTTFSFIEYIREFQFPSNGKVFPNVAPALGGPHGAGFNSLQTGRSFRTNG